MKSHTRPQSRGTLLPGTSLPGATHRLLHFAARVAPASDRPDFLRAWHAELLYSETRTPHGSLVPGLLRDALWLRSDACRRALAGTAFLCLATLATLVLLAALPAAVGAHGWRALLLTLVRQTILFTLASSLTLVVARATAARPIHAVAAVPLPRRLRARAFLAAKVLLLLFLAFLLSLDLFAPLEPAFPITGFLLRTLAFVALALLALRWSADDHDHRCRHCLRSLQPPSRIGRPSYNFLSWSGTSLTCRDGHGLLTIPELETSWCQSRQWQSSSSRAAAS